MRTATTILTIGLENEVTLSGTPYAVRCAVAIAETNIPDARWALEVLNTYGHLVRHAADRDAA
jgi:hypothetical protein